jgi:hypothetical protein
MPITITPNMTSDPMIFPAGSYRLKAHAKKLLQVSSVRLESVPALNAAGKFKDFRRIFQPV